MSRAWQRRWDQGPVQGDVGTGALYRGTQALGPCTGGLHEQNDLQSSLKTLPSRNFVGGSKYESKLYRKYGTVVGKYSEVWKSLAKLSCVVHAKKSSLNKKTHYFGNVYNFFSPYISVNLACRHSVWPPAPTSQCVCNGGILNKVVYIRFCFCRENGK